MKPEELKLIAESLGHRRFLTDSEGKLLYDHDDEWEIFNPLANKAQEMDLVRAYREKLKDFIIKYPMSHISNNFLGMMWKALESPEDLCQAYLKLIKGEGEAL